MSHDEKINYMRIACNIAAFNLKNEHLDLLVSLYEIVVKKQGKTDVKDVIQIEKEVSERETERLIKKVKQNEQKNLHQ